MERILAARRQGSEYEDFNALFRLPATKLLLISSKQAIVNKNGIR